MTMYRWNLLVRLALCLMAVVALVCVRTAFAQETPFPQTSDYVDDFAHILSPEDVHRLTVLCRDLDERTGYQLVIVTVDSLKGEDINHAATRYGIEKRAGRKGEDTGLVIMRAVAEKRTFIATGKGTEAVITDAFAGDVFRNTIRPLTRQGRVGDGLYAGAVRLRNRILERTGQGGARLPEGLPAPAGGAAGPPFSGVFLILLAVGFIGIVIAVVKGVATMYRCPRCRTYLNVTDAEVQPPGLLTSGYGIRTRSCPACGYSDQQRYTIPVRSTYYGGGGGGGGSFWGGSSGFSGGDSGFSGGGFSGGGGDFGGGGAGGED